MQPPRETAVRSLRAVRFRYAKARQDGSLRATTISSSGPRNEGIVRGSKRVVDGAAIPARLVTAYEIWESDSADKYRVQEPTDFARTLPDLLWSGLSNREFKGCFGEQHGEGEIKALPATGR